MNSIDPVQFARSYLRELEASRMKEAGLDDGAAQSHELLHDEMMWYNPEGKTIPDKPPTLYDFNRDIKKLQEMNAGERTINAYCGLSLLMAIIAVANAGVSPLAGPLFVGIAGSIGKTLAGPEMEQEFGRKASLELVGKTGISKSEELTRRFETVAGKLLTHSSLEAGAYKLLVLDSEEINAHSAPGHLFVTRGMMEAFPSDGELALFIGHEIAHAEDRDAIEDIGQNLFEQLTLSSTLLKSKVKVEGTDKTVGDYRKELKESFYSSTLAYDRENELLADRRGAELMQKAGFPADEARSAIKAICDYEEKARLEVIRKDVYQKKGYYDDDEIARRLQEQKKFNDHPTVAERLKSIEEVLS
ncbi:MAG: M48 family metalloprotease [Candidatus Xenobiia bacterium LiM19]